MHPKPVISLLLLSLAACGDGDPAGPIPAELAGRWDAAPHCTPQCRFVLRSLTDPTDSLNVTDRLSATLRLDIQRSGAYTFRLSGAGTTGFDESGTLTLDDGTMILAGPSGTDTLDYALAMPILRLEFRERLAFDFDGDGTDEDTAATAHMLKIE